jgi:signal transduction histidine kinase/DNA-binding response OmpR family regulator
MNIRKAFARKFSYKVFFTFLALVIASSVAFTVVFVRHQSNSISDTLIKEGLSLANLFAHSSSIGAMAENEYFLEEPIKGVLENEGVTAAYVFTADGELLSSKGKTEDIDPKGKEQIMTRLNESLTPYSFEHPDHYGFWAPIISEAQASSDDALFFDTGVPKKTRVIGYVRVDISKDILNKSIKLALIKSLLISFVFLLIGSMVALYLAKRVTKPLSKLAAGALALGKGEEDLYIPIDTGDEIGQLAESFNEMAESLKKREAEKQRLMEQLNQSQRLEAIGTFAGGIAHDFNNILAIIQGSMDVAKMKSPDYMKQYIERAFEATNRGSDLVKRLLHFAHESKAETEAVNIGFIAKGTVKLISETIDPRINMTVNVPDDIGDVKSNSGQVHQIVMNLCGNARDAIMERMDSPDVSAEMPFSIDINLSNVTISDTSSMDNPNAVQGDFVLLSIKDNGSGMDIETVQHIFEPFFTTKPIGKGTGLGLSSIYGIIKSHGGWIDVKSEVGKGTTIDVYLPRYSGESIEEQPQKECCKTEVVGGSERILLVDDEEHILSAMKEKLECLGYDTVLARDGLEAFEILKKKRKKYDLIVLDHVMPKLSGLEVVQRIRNLNIKTPVLMQSGKDLSQYANVFEGVEFISKPYTLDALALRIRKILGYEWGYHKKTNIERVRLYYVNEQTVPYNEEIADSYEVYELFKYLANEPRETFIAVYLDPQHKIIAYDPLSTGTTDKATVFPKEVIRTALLANASAVILLHNHPSGSCRPSSNDVVLTSAIAHACKVMDIRVLDHLIICSEGYYSFASENLL